MQPPLPCLEERADGSLLLRLHVQPRAARSGLAGLLGDQLKLRLTSPPVDGQANKAVVAFFAKLFHLPKASLTIEHGLQSRNKTVRIAGADPARVRSVLAGQLAGAED